MVGSEASVFNPSEKGIISFYLGAWWTSPSVSCLPTNFGYFGTQPHSMISKEIWRQGSAKAFLGCSSPTKYIYIICMLQVGFKHVLSIPWTTKIWTCTTNKRGPASLRILLYDITHIPREVRDATVTFSRCWEVHLGQSVASRFSKSQQLWISGVVREVWPNGSVHVQYEEAQSLCC